MIAYLLSAYYPFLLIIIFSNIIYTHLSYSLVINRSSSLYLIFCVLCGMVSNTAWGILMQITKNNTERFLLGQIWDLIPLITFCVVPPIVYGVGLMGWRLWVGLILIIAGTFLVSYADKY